MAHRRHKEAIIAWLNGEEIQYRLNSCDKWKTIPKDAPFVGFKDTTQYRVRPQPKYYLSVSLFRDLTPYSVRTETKHIAAFTSSEQAAELAKLLNDLSEKAGE